MKVTLHGGPLDGLEVDVRQPPPRFILVETEQGEVRRAHLYGLHQGRYEHALTEKDAPEANADD